MTVLVVGPGASWSTADVEAGVIYGLEAHGVTVLRYRLDERIEHARRFLGSAYARARRRGGAGVTPPGIADIYYLAAQGVLERALRHSVDVVLVVSAMYLHPDAIVLLKRAGLRVAVLFTESPYDLGAECAIARLVDHCWTNERAALPAFRAVTPHVTYLPHAFHPLRHTPDPGVGEATIPRHDVVFVGSAFPERIAWLGAVDWTGIDLGLYGNWAALPSRHVLRRAVKGGAIANPYAAALYRRARIGLNLYRTCQGASGPAITTPAESLNPRAYELAACGVFHVSAPRAEVEERFGPLVPIVADPAIAGATIRAWLADAPGRAAIAAQLPARVAAESWVDRAGTVLADLARLVEPSTTKEVRYVALSRQ